MSAKIGAIFWPHERQAPIIRPATEGGDCEAGRLAGKGESGGRRYVWVPAAEARSFCTEGPAGRVVPATGEYRVTPGERGEGPRHPASARKSQHNYPAKTLRAVGDGVGRAEPLARAFQLSPSTATETKKKRVRPPPLSAIFCKMTEQIANRSGQKRPFRTAKRFQQKNPSFLHGKGCF